MFTRMAGTNDAFKFGISKESDPNNARNAEFRDKWQYFEQLRIADVGPVDACMMSERMLDEFDHTEMDLTNQASIFAIREYMRAKISKNHLELLINLHLSKSENENEGGKPNDKIAKLSKIYESKLD